MAMQRKLRIALIYSGRFPGEKAGALFAAKSAEAFAEQGVEVTLIVPKRRDSMKQTPQQVWGVPDSFAVRLLPVVNLFPVRFFAPIAFFVALITYVPVVFLYLLFSRRSFDLIYSNEAYPLLAASFLAPCVYELHDFPRRTLFLYRILFRRLLLIVSTNEWKKQQLIERFGVPAERILVERNAVDLAINDVSKETARTHLGLEGDRFYVVYTGQLYSWKGTDTLAATATFLPNAVIVFVGGLGHDLERFKARWGQQKNIRIVGQVPHGEVVYWQKAADVLVIPNTAKEAISEFYTSPMKLFEYMAAERPIIASDIPSIREVLGDEMAYFAEPDNASSFASAITGALDNPMGAIKKARLARANVVAHTWQKRSARILDAIRYATDG
ncbi:glycosyltransferase family 1 protein [Candidatus Parcubacteria bacterium]|nr:MAG: glycosyltransferase family 1 protein [Candidatus Parcubacteria bacterium]